MEVNLRNTLPIETKRRKKIPAAFLRRSPLMPGLILLAITLFPSVNLPAGENDWLTWREPATGMEFIWITGGCFQMGQNKTEKGVLYRESGKEKYQRYYSDELPAHQVCLNGFWLGRYEVTKGEWQAVMDAPQGESAEPKSAPADHISWNNASRFVTSLGKKTGRSFRLPTEAEWEYAARAGSQTPFFTGNTIDTSQANFNGLYIYGGGERGIYREKPESVGKFPPNSFGLYDILGNVWEWCADWYDKDYYSHSSPKNPKGPAGGTKKVMRGGSWFTSPRSLRAANRRGIHPATAVADCGLRIIINRPEPSAEILLFDEDF